MPKNLLLQLKSVSVKVRSNYLVDQIDFELKENENWLITGPSGSGKTIFGKLLAGVWQNYNGEIRVSLSAKDIHFIPQQVDFSELISGRTAYYDQRFDGNEKDVSPWVKSLFNTENLSPQIKNYLEQLSISGLEEKRIHQLSNGEGKRVQLALTLLKSPKLIVIDNPFIGLDSETRKVLTQLIDNLISEGIQIVVITKWEEAPPLISHVVELQKGKITFKGARKSYLLERTFSPEKGNTLLFPEEKIQELKLQRNYRFNYAVEMNNVNVTYGNKTVLSNINWKVKQGERWALIGHNGAGKSTLLSLITADNPQGYKNDLKLFGIQRGSGESIWEIKNKIGFVSPELHRFYERKKSISRDVQQSMEIYNQRGLNILGVNALETVVSGFYEQVGFAKDVSSQQKRIAALWLEILGIEHLKLVRLNQLSLGEQRLVLLARSLVKNPPLLLLDEPCQGLDEQQIERFKTVVDAICLHFNKTLIYVSHYENEIPNCVNKRILLKEGKIEAIND